jgi:hypothetical protein
MLMLTQFDCCYRQQPKIAARQLWAINEFLAKSCGCGAICEMCAGPDEPLGPDTNLFHQK